MALTKVTYTDLVTIIGAQNLNDIQDAIIALEEWQSEAGADIPQILADIAPRFSNSTNYSAGDCVIVLNKLYQFTAAHPAGNWTGTDATEVNVTSLLKEAVASLSGEVDDLKSAFDDVTETIFAPVVSIDTTTMKHTEWYVNTSGVINSSTGSTTLSLSIPIEAAGTYYISKNESPKFRIGYCMTDPYNGVTLSGFQNLGTATSASIVLPAESYLVICYFVNDSSAIDKDALTNSIVVKQGLDEISAVDLVARAAIFTKKPYVNTEQNFLYDVGNGYKTRGFLKLPPNYTPYGKPVPLIVFVHGSGDIPFIQATSMTASYDDYYNYLRDCGYAIFDCYGYSDKFSGAEVSNTNTWGVPICDACYESGINYVCKNWNIDKENIFAACKSLGGLQALNMFYKPRFPVKAVGMLSPELNWVAMTIGYQTSERQFNASELGFSPDVDNVLVWSGTRPSGFNDYILANADKWVGAFTNFSGLPISDADKINYFYGIQNTKTMNRIGPNKPLKIWIASDDDSVSYANAEALVLSLRNCGGKAEIRTMPANTGKHHAVDNDPNALQTTNVTTKLGITYATIPTAYYELGQFFDQYNTQ